jgi:uncharacterized membrane protein
MFAQLVGRYHLHPIVDHFTIALLTFGIAAEILSSATVLIPRGRRGLFAVLAREAPIHVVAADDRRRDR